METTKEKASYCIGLETGKNLRQQFSDMDLDRLMEGIKDGLIDEAPKLSIEEIRSIVQALRNQIETQQRQYLATMAEQNRKDGESFLQINKQNEEVQVLPSGLQYQVLRAGNGPIPSLFDVVNVHYKGSFIDGRIFESSYEKGQPQAFPVSRVIPGWSEALQKMQVGDKWKITIPSYLAYGEHGFGPAGIGPNCTLVFEMELMGINNS